VELPVCVQINRHPIATEKVGKSPLFSGNSIENLRCHLDGWAGGIWMLHNYWKIAWFEGRQDELSHSLWPQLIAALKVRLCISITE
jgi:hypothetical protein